MSDKLPEAFHTSFLMTWLKSPLCIIIATQLLFTASDIIARAHMRQSPFQLSTFVNFWFLIYFLIRQLAMLGQLYVFSELPVGKSMALFGASSIIIVNVLGFLLLAEVLSTQAYLGVGLAVLAFVVLAVSP